MTDTIKRPVKVVVANVLSGDCELEDANGGVICQVPCEEYANAIRDALNGVDAAGLAAYLLRLMPAIGYALPGGWDTAPLAAAIQAYRPATVSTPVKDAEGLAKHIEQYRDSDGSNVIGNDMVGYPCIDTDTLTAVIQCYLDDHKTPNMIDNAGSGESVSDKDARGLAEYLKVHVLDYHTTDPMSGFMEINADLLATVIATYQSDDRVKRLVEAAEEASKELADVVKMIGPCELDIGICNCVTIRRADALRSALTPWTGGKV
jgi:hypothetical protein